VADSTAIVPRSTDSYGKLLTGRFGEHYRQAASAFDKLDLSGELSIIRALLMKMLERIEAADEEKRPKVGEVVALTKEIRALVKQVVEVEDKFGSMISIGTLRIFMVQLQDIILEEVKDERVRERVARRCSKIALPANEREAERLRRAAGKGRVPSPDA
jgi:hypothetical protein